MQPSAEESAATTTESGTSWSRACSAATCTSASVRRAPACVSSRGSRSGDSGGFFTQHSVPGCARGIYVADAEDLRRALGAWLPEDSLAIECEAFFAATRQWRFLLAGSSHERATY